MTMESISDYKQEGVSQTLDLSSHSKREVDRSNTAILDLSCKDRVRCTSAESTNTTIAHPFVSPANAGKQYQQPSLSYAEKQNPVAANVMMLPSETNSPKEAKYEPTYGNNGQVNDRPLMIVPSLNIPALYPSLSNGEPIQIPIATPKTLMQYGEMPLPFFDGAAKTPISMPSVFPTSMPSAEEGLLVPSPDTMKKAMRPFKAYSKELLFKNLNNNSKKMFDKYREKMLGSVKKLHDNTPNPRMRRASKLNSPGSPTSTIDEKDAAYRERRRKNNEAAKRSRDLRRAKEDELAIRTFYLEQENEYLKLEVARYQYICAQYNIQI